VATGQLDAPIMISKRARGWTSSAVDKFIAGRVRASQEAAR
jgi:hypothetical protein